MKGVSILNDMLLEERQVPPGKKYVVLFDIDDTLISPENIFIWKKKDGKETPLTPAQYAKENVKEERANGVEYDYREFRDPKKVAESITTGKPIWKNVRIYNDHIKNGWDVGILTARGLEDVIFEAINKWTMFQQESGLVSKLAKPLARNLVHAISDEVKVYKGSIDFEKKANVIKEYAKTYDKVKVVDDDDKNINAFKALKLPNVIVVKAWKE